VIERRIGLLFACFLGLLAFAVLRTAWLGTIKGDRLAQAASTQQVSDVTVPARRGEIVDRRGVELAVTEPAADVSATPYLVKSPVRVAARLAPLLERPEDEIASKLAGRDTGFAYLARGIPASAAQRISALRIEGIAVTPGGRRTYPREWLASQLLGAVGVDGKGLAGIEYAREGVLHGRDGRRRSVNSGLGKSVSVRDTRAAEPGARLELTVDAAIQDKVEEVLVGVGRTFRPKGATAVVMDPRDGSVLALANWPRVNANAPSAAPAYATQDRAVGFTYEPGSTFKSFTVAGALQEGVVTPTTKFDLPPKIQVADRVIGESHDRGPEVLNTADILAQSSNVGAVKIGLALKAKRFDHWARRFGFGKTTGVDIPGEERGLLLPLEKYSGSTMGNLPIGQGLSVTPIQMATAYAAIANGGMLRPPHIVGSIGGRRVATPRGRRVVSARVAGQVRQMLRGVLKPGGTASEVEIPGYELAGKTGTANKFDEKLGQYSQADYVSSFVGFAPARDPRLLISVMVDEPHGAIYGSEVAAPAFQKIAAFSLPYLEIAPTPPR
jgi:cell division protein FtsI (penicillin-binding protein 3)